jgi:hypothetical protein
MRHLRYQLHQMDRIMSHAEHIALGRKALTYTCTAIAIAANITVWCVAAWWLSALFTLLFSLLVAIAALGTKLGSAWGSARNALSFGRKAV